MKKYLAWIAVLVVILVILSFFVIPPALDAIKLSFPEFAASFGIDPAEGMPGNPFKELPEQITIFKDPENPFEYKNPFESEEKK